jgi:hypothetical protein
MSHGYLVLFLRAAEGTYALAALPRSSNLAPGRTRAWISRGYASGTPPIITGR